MSLRQRLLGRIVPVVLVAAGLVGAVPALGPVGTHTAAAQTPLPIGVMTPVFSETLVGGFTQAGNTLLQCAGRTSQTPGAPPLVPTPDRPDGCVRDIDEGLSLVNSNPDNLPFYNNQVTTKFLNRAPDPNVSTFSSSSATVDVPAGAVVVEAELSWLGTSQANVNPDIAWNPDIWKDPMLMSVGDDQHFVSVTPEQGASIMPGSPAADTNDFYFKSSANVTQYLEGKTGQIVVWGANAPFPDNGFDQAGSGWNITVVYQYSGGVDLNASPPHIAKEITVQEGFAYQQAGKPATDTDVNVPAVTDTANVQVGLIAGEGDTGLSGDTFSINDDNIAHPVTGQTNNFFVSYAQGATDPNWTSNFSTDNVSWTLAPGIVPNGSTTIRLSTTTNGDGYFLSGMNTAFPVPAVCLAKAVDTNPYTTAGQTLTYTYTVTNCSGAPIDRITVSDNFLGPLPASCNQTATLDPGASYTCRATHDVTPADIAAGSINNTATANAFIPGTTTAVEPATATATTNTSTTLLITKAGSAPQVNAGAPFSYTITVTNTGGADAADVAVRDPLPPELTSPTAVVTSGPPGSTATISGTTLTATAALLPHAPPNTLVITVSGTMGAPTTGTTVTNRATVVAGGNTNCPAPPATASTDPNCSSTVDTQVFPLAPINITKTVSNSTPRPGDTFTYTVQLTNTSDTTTALATVSDPIPPQLTSASWTCSASTGSTCATPNGTGNITGVGVTLLPLGVATFTITVTLPATYPGGPITNTATATPGTNTFCEAPSPPTSCSDDVTINPFIPPATLTITKAHAPPLPVADGPISYTVTVTNTSGTIGHGTFSDPLPPQLNVASASWTCDSSTGSTCGSLTGTGSPGVPTPIPITVAPNGGTVTFTIHATVSENYDGTDITQIGSVTPGTNTECADGEPTCDAADIVANPAKLDITKAHTLSNPAPGVQQVTYTVTITNPGDTAVGSGAFSDPLPGELDTTTATWTCTPGGTGSKCGSASGTGSPSGVAITVGPSGGTVTFTITATIANSQIPQMIHNVGSVTPGPGSECADGSTPSCDAPDTITFTPEPAPLSITKTLSPTTPPVAGQAITYTVTVTNNSNTTVAHGTLTDPVPDQIVADGTWTTATTGTGTTVSPATGPGFPAGVTLVIAPTGSVTFTIPAHVSPTYNGANVTNTASVTPSPPNTVCADGTPTCDAQVSFVNPARLSVVKVRTPEVATPGGTVVYQVIVTNNSGSVGSGDFTDELPTELDVAAATWNCTPSAGSTCGSTTGTGSPGVPTAIPITVAPAGGTVTFVITARVLPSPVAVTVHNVASVMPTDNTTCESGQTTCTGEDTFTATPPPATLEVTKTHGESLPAAGGPITYTVTVTNTSTTTLAAGDFSDPLPTELTGATWTCTPTPPTPAPPAVGSSCGSATGSGSPGVPTPIPITVAPSGTVTFTIDSTLSATWNGSTVTNTASVTPGTNTQCADGQPTCDAPDSFTNPGKLSVVKVRSPAVPRPGGTVVYRVIVTNPVNGGVGAGDFSDPLPPELDGATASWTCTAAGTGSTCGSPGGSGSPGVPTPIPITVAPGGGTVTFVITATVLPTPVSVTVHNVASVTPTSPTECVDGNPTCNGEDIFLSTPPPATITIAKTLSTTPTPTQGQPVSYTVTVTNTSTTTQAEGTVNDPFDSPALTGITWTATATGTGSSVTPASGSGAFSNVAVVLAPSGTVTFTVDATVAADWPGGNVINTSVVTPGTNTECDATADASCSATENFPTPSLISIVKTHEPTNPVPQPGQTVLYAVTVTNLSDQQVAHATFSDPLPAALDAAAAVWTTVTTGSGTTVSPASGTGSPTGVVLTLAPGGAVTFVITAPILSSFPGGTITNTGTATPGENTACESGQPPCEASTSFVPTIPPAPVSIAKSVTPAGPFAPGDHLTYTLILTNHSTGVTANGSVTDPVPIGIVAMTWTVVASPGSTISPPSGSGAITGAFVIAPAGTVTYTVAATIDPAFASDFDIVNTGTVIPGTNTTCIPNIVSQACDANAVIHVVPPPVPPTPTPTPVPIAPVSPTAPPSLPVTG